MIAAHATLFQMPGTATAPSNGAVPGQREGTARSYLSTVQRLVAACSLRVAQRGGSCCYDDIKTMSCLPFLRTKAAQPTLRARASPRPCAVFCRALQRQPCKGTAVAFLGRTRLSPRTPCAVARRVLKVGRVVMNRQMCAKMIEGDANSCPKRTAC